MKIPLVLLSGLLSDHSLWQHQMHYLSECASVQIISASQNSPEQMIQAILNEAPPKFALAGHSMGGWLCLEVMRAAPSRVTQLCLLNTTSRMDSEEKRQKRQELVLKAKGGRFQQIVEEMVEKFVFNPDAKSKVKKMFLELGPNIFVNQQEAMMARHESQSILSTITCPTLVIHAAKDNIFSIEEHRELVSQIRGAKLAIVEDSGHMSPLEMPQAITALLRYWLAYGA